MTMKFKITKTTTKVIERNLHEYYEDISEENALDIERDLAEDNPDVYLEGGETKIVVERID